MATFDRRLVRVVAFAFLLAATVYAVVLTTRYFLLQAPKHRAESAWLILLVVGWVAALWQSRRELPAGSLTRFGPAHVGLTIMAFIALAFGIFWSTLALGLLSDDFVLIERAARGQLAGGSQFFRPLPLLVWRVADWLSGDPWLLHALNILLHGVNAALVVTLARSCGVSPTAAAAAGLLFICFPAAVEAVGWASGIQDVLVTTCCLGFVLACGLETRRQAGLALSIGALLAALATKETAVIAPVLAFIAWFGHGSRWHPQRVVCGAVVAGTYAVWRLSVLGDLQRNVGTPSRYLVKELFGRLFGSLAVPFTRVELLQYPLLGIGTACLLAVLLLGAFWRISQDGGLAGLAARCPLWAVVAVLPLWSMFFVSDDLQGSRYLYLPACGWSILLAALMFQWEGRASRAVGVLLAAALGAVWLTAGHWHLDDWHEAARLRDRVVARAAARLEAAPCDTVYFAGVPDSVGGAYVFRNGFVEAVEREGLLPGTVRTGTGGEPGCNLGWDGETFRQRQ